MLPRTMTMVNKHRNESFDVGCDTCSPVSNQYKTPFAFTGKIINRYQCRDLRGSRCETRSACTYGFGDTVIVSSGKIHPMQARFVY